MTDLVDNPLVTRQGVEMPRLLYGTAWKKARTAALVTQAATAGFRGFDTAAQPKHYAEAAVGEGLAACRADGLTRADFYLQTKFTPLTGQDPGNVPYDPAAPLADQVAQSFASSLRNLQTDYVDGLVLHAPLPGAALQVAWAALEAVFDRGGARQLGISNCYELATLEGLFQRARIKPAVVQNRFHARTHYDGEIRAFCRRHGIVYQSFWTLTANAQILGHARVRALATRHRRSAAQILFRYLTQIGIVPLTGTQSPTHMREDLAIFDFELTLDEQAGLAPLFR